MLSFLGGLLGSVFKSILELWAMIRLGEAKQQGADKDAELQVAKDEASIASKNDAADDDALRRKLLDPKSYRG